MDEQALAEIEEIKKLREIEEIRRLRGSEQKKTSYESAITSPGMGTAASAFATGIADVSQIGDRLVGAPIRAGIVGAIEPGKYADDSRLGGAVSGFSAQFGKDPSLAPSGKELAIRAGLPSGEVSTGFVTNPYTRQTAKVSPAGFAGAVGEMATDPLTYATLPAAKGGAYAATRMAPELAQYLEKQAALRAVKGVTGEKVSEIRRMANIPTKRAGDIERAEGRLVAKGKDLLASDAEGGPAVGWLGTSESIGKRAAEKKDFWWKQIEEVGNKLDAANPEGAISGKEMADRLLQYASDIPPTEHGKAIQERVMREAANLERQGNMTFRQAMDWKGGIGEYNPQSPDAFTSNQDAINKMKGVIDNVIGDTMNEIAPGLRPMANRKYSSFKSASDAATSQSAQGLARRIIAPSDYATAATATLAQAAGGAPIDAAMMIKSAALAAAHKFARERGSAFAARSMNALSKAFAKYPEQMAKYEKLLRNAAIAGGESLVARHHLLMNNDPQYREIVQGEE